MFGYRAAPLTRPGDPVSIDTMLKALAVHAFEDNYIWLIRNETSQYTAIVDPGDAEPVMEALDTLQLTPTAILVTHHHFDHTGGIEDLRRRYDLRVLGPAHESIAGLTTRLEEGDRARLPELHAEFTVIDVPGHTRGHIAFHGHDMLFCGDTLFSVGCGRLFEGTAAQMYDSLEKLRALDDGTQIYCAHEYTLANIRFAKVVEPNNTHLLAREAEAQARRRDGDPTVPSSLGLEKHTNPFLRSHIPNVIAAAENFAGQRLSGGADVFAAVRKWKDAFD